MTDRNDAKLIFTQSRAARLHLWLGPTGVYKESDGAWRVTYSTLDQPRDFRTMILDDWDTLLTVASQPNVFVLPSPHDSLMVDIAWAYTVDAHSITQHGIVTTWHCGADVERLFLTVNFGSRVYVPDVFPPRGRFGAFWFVLHTLISTAPQYPHTIRVPAMFSLHTLKTFATVDGVPWAPLRPPLV